MKSLEQDLLKELLNYDPETGVFTWAVDRGGIKAGAVAGCKKPDGYILLRVNRTLYRAHRLAWVYMYGSITEGLTVDHKNGIRDDNRIENLRLATRPQQSQNQTFSSRNSSGITGVYFITELNKWRARITINKKSIHLGLFDTPEAANDARIKAKAELHTFNPIQRTSL